MSSTSQRYDWVVLNQSQSPAFQQMIEELSTTLGRCLLLTGLPYPTNSGTIDVVAAPPYVRSSFAKRAISWQRYLLGAAQQLVALRSPPFVLAVTNPPMLPHLAWLFGQLKKLRYGLLVWDIYPDHIVHMGWLRERNPAIGAWRVLNRLAIRDAEVVITLSERMADTLREQAGAHCSIPIEVIPNWADTEQIQPLLKRQNSFAHAHGEAETPLTVLYSGNIGATHDLDALIDAAALLRDRSDISFVIIGDGLGRAKLERRLLGKRPPNVKLLPRQPWDVLPRSLALGDVAVVAQRAGTEHLSMPSKTYSALAAGSALLALCDQHASDLATLVTQHDIGVVCPLDDPRAIASSLVALREDPEQLARMRIRARKLSERYFSAHAVREAYQQLLSPIVGASC